MTCEWGDRATHVARHWQSLTHPGSALWGWAGGAATWVPLLGGAQSWSCEVSCKESQSQKGPEFPPPYTDCHSRAREAKAEFIPVSVHPATGQGFGSP
jgi:hypothetical protein